MSGWPTIGAAANTAMLNAFGEPVVYQFVQGGLAVGEPVTIVAVRHARVPVESGGTANAEEVSVNPADLPSYPQRGDWITAWGSLWVVSAVRQPDPYGLVQLSLTRLAQ